MGVFWISSYLMGENKGAEKNCRGRPSGRPARTGLKTRPYIPRFVIPRRVSSVAMSALPCHSEGAERPKNLDLSLRSGWQREICCCDCHASLAM